MEAHEMFGTEDERAFLITYTATIMAKYPELKAAEAFGQAKKAWAKLDRFAKTEYSRHVY